jgi:DNA-binding MarR family transcriptional regulator
MMRRGLVVREQGEEDRRKTHVYLTAAGRAIRPAVLADVAAATAQCYHGVSKAELAAALALFDRLASNAERDDR